METTMLRVNGAELYIERRGHGPFLIMISGAGGDAGYYSEVAELLSDAFTVVNYDRRANSRSTGAKDRPMVLSEHVDDAKAIIDEIAGGRALVFGNSGGAIIGLELASRYPACVRALIAHEPPAVRALAKDDPWHTFFDQIGVLYVNQGFEAATSKFLSTVRGDDVERWPQDLTQRVMGNFEHLFRCEWSAFGQFVPDYQALSDCPFPIFLAAGSDDRGLYYARPSIEIAKKIGASWAEFPGVHLEFITRPEIFAAALRPLLTYLHEKVGGAVAPWKVL